MRDEEVNATFNKQCKPPLPLPKSPHLHRSPPGLLITSYLTHSPPSLIHKPQALGDLTWGYFQCS